jgi:hypothetical protein
MIDTATTTASLAPAAGWVATFRGTTELGAVACWMLRADRTVVGLLSDRKKLVPADSYPDFAGYSYRPGAVTDF